MSFLQHCYWNMLLINFTFLNYSVGIIRSRKICSNLSGASAVFVDFELVLVYCYKVDDWTRFVLKDVKVVSTVWLSLNLCVNISWTVDVLQDCFMFIHEYCLSLCMWIKCCHTDRAKQWVILWKINKMQFAFCCITVQRVQREDNYNYCSTVKVLHSTYILCWR